MTPDLCTRKIEVSPARNHGLHCHMSRAIRAQQEDEMTKGMNRKKETKKPKKEAAKPVTTISVASSKGGLNVNKTKE